MSKNQQWTNYQGQHRQNMDGFWYLIGERTGEYRYGKPLYHIHFDSNFESIATSQDLWRNQIKDWGSPSVLGAGIVGWLIPKPTKHPLWSRWLGILKRCLTNDVKGYEDVSVCERWLRFELFVEDAAKLPNYDPERLDELTIDKDKLAPADGTRIYSPSTCCWLTIAEQAVYQRPHRRTKAPQCPYRGVHWTDKRWIARVQFQGKRRYLGYFRDSLRAARTIMAMVPGYYFPEEQARILADIEAARAKRASQAGLGEEAA